MLVIRTTGFEEYLDSSGEAHLKALILGAPSAGKTRSASFWPSPIYADCEKGRASIADRKMPYGEILTQQDMSDLLDRLERECKRPQPERRWQTFVLDTLDSYQRIVITEYLKANRKDSMSGWQDWGHLDNRMTALIARLHKLPMNVVVNVHTKGSKDGDDGPIVLNPKLKGDLREQISGDFDLVGHMTTHYEAVDGKRVLKRSVRWHPHPEFPVLKDRFGRLPMYTDVDFSEQDYLQLYDAILGNDLNEDLPASEVVETIEGAPLPAVEPPRPGGPVAAKATAKKAAKAAEPKSEAAPRAAAKKAAPPKVDPKAGPAGPPPASVQPGTAPAKAEVHAPESGASPAPASSAQDPDENARSQADVVDEAAPAATEAAVAAVKEGLGGTVVTTPPAAEEPRKEVATTPNVSTGPEVFCGTPGKRVGPQDDPVDGCGQSLAGEDVDMVNIALIKSKHYLCLDCLNKFKALKASQKTAAKAS